MTSQGIYTLNQWAILWGALTCLIAFHWLSTRRRIPKGLHLPPGPPGKLIFGNASDMPTEQEWKTFTKWGDLVHVKILNTDIIFVNSVDVVHDLFERRSSLYSDRFISPMVYDLMGASWIITFMPYGDRWRQHRRVFNQYFHQSAVVAYHEVQINQTRKFLKRLHESPDQFMKHIRHLSGAIIMEMTYGIQVLHEGDPYIEAAESATSAFAAAGTPGAFMVDTFPILKYVPAWMPGAGFHRKARSWRVPITNMAVVPFEVVKKRLAAGTANPSLLTSLLEDLTSGLDDPSDDQEDIIRNIAGVAYLGGADTTVSAITSFVLAMVLHPEFQHRAQDELDTVIGNRLPVFEDRKDLPYVNALCKEVLRWHPVVPLAVAHRVTQDDVYGDFFIPAGSIVIGNAWGMLHDEKVFGPEPEKFNPERFLKPGVRDPTFAFGFGRRICPGRYMADNSIFIAVASILKLFDIAHARDSNGDEIFVKDACTSGFLSYPEPFQCAFKLRSGAESLLAGCTD